MQRVHAVMRKANMCLVSQEEYRDAIEHDFNMGLDMYVRVHACICMQLREVTCFVALRLS